MVKKRGLEKEFEIDSCGTAGYHIGEEPDERRVLLYTFPTQRGVRTHACHADRPVDLPELSRYVGSTAFLSITKLVSYRYVLWSLPIISGAGRANLDYFRIRKSRFSAFRLRQIRLHPCDGLVGKLEEHPEDSAEGFESER
jgi:hypothetical protein